MRTQAHILRQTETLRHSVKTAEAVIQIIVAPGCGAMTATDCRLWHLWISDVAIDWFSGV